jgi:hypothetical protein
MNEKGSDADISKNPKKSNMGRGVANTLPQLNKKSTTPTIQFLTCPLLKFIIVYNVFQFMFVLNPSIYRRTKVILKLFNRII